MKLRLRHNSIRLRLTQSEVAEFAESGSVEERIEFGGDTQFRFRLERSDDVHEITSSFSDGCITVAVPESEGSIWAQSDQVGLETAQNIDSGRSLQILIEKDFACLEPRAGGEDDDTFPNPLKCGNPDSEILEQ